MRIRIGVLLGLISVLTCAGEFEDSTADAYSFAGEQKSYIQGMATGTDSRSDSYGGQATLSENTHPCNQVNEKGVKTCGGETAKAGENPSQYYGMSRAQLEDEARVKASSDDNAKYVLGAHDVRPQFDIKPEDPLFKFEQENQTNMVGLTNSYSGCKNIKYGSEGVDQTKTCKKTGYRSNVDNTCRRTYAGTCNWVTTHKFNVYVNNNQIGTTKKADGNVYTMNTNGSMNTAASSIAYVHHDMPDTATGTMTWDLKKSSLTGETTLFVQYTRWVADVDNKKKYYPQLKINGGTPTWKGSYWGIAKKTYRYVATFSGLSGWLREGQNTIELNTFGGKIEIKKMANMKESMECEQQYSSTLMCSEGGIAGSAFVSSTCVDNKDRVIDGVTFTKSCWVQDEVYRRPGPPAYKEEALCDQLRAQGCGVKSENCTKWHSDGWCEAATLNMSCGAGPTQTMEVCGESLVCADGKCYDPYKEAEPNNTQDFMKAASYLAAMEDMKKQFDPDNVTVWKGEYMTCKVKDSAVGGDRCCTGGKGFLSTAGGGCDANEEAIAKAKQDERVSFIRSRKVCEQRIAGSCVLEVTYMDFCTWPSKLARIVQDQGRPQMGQIVDKPCDGFKLQNPNEFQLINWDLIDLSDYFSNVQTKYDSTAKPDGQELKNQQQQSNGAVQDEYAKKYQQYYGD